MSMAKRYGEDDLVGFITDETEDNAYNKEQELRGLLREKNRQQRAKGVGQTTSFGTPSTGSGSGSGLQLQHQVSLGPGGRIGSPGSAGGMGPGGMGPGGRITLVGPGAQPAVPPPTIAPPPNIVYPGYTDSGGGVAPPPPTVAPAGGDGGYTDVGPSTSIAPVDTSQQAQPTYSDGGAYAGGGEEAPGPEEGPAPAQQAPQGQEQIIVSEDEAPKPKVEEESSFHRFLDKLKNLFK